MRPKRQSFLSKQDPLHRNDVGSESAINMQHQQERLQNLSISQARETQTDLDVLEFQQNDTESASRMEDSQQSEDDLEKEMAERQQVINKHEEQPAECLNMTKQSLIDTQLEKTAASQRCIQNRLRLGHFVQRGHGETVVEEWVDGYAFTNLMKKQEAVAHEKEEIDKQRKLLSKRRPSTSNSKPRVISPNNSDSLSFETTDSNALFENKVSNDSQKSGAKPETPKNYTNRRRDQIDYYEQEKILILRLVALQKEESELQLEFEKLERERDIYIRKLKNKEKSRSNNHQIPNDRYLYITYCLIIALLVVALISPHSFPQDQAVEEKGTTINLGCIDEINKKYPGLLSSKKLRTIKARIGVMNREVSKLMLLGQSRDSHCNIDPTFCVGQTIANVTQVQFGYIDASDPHLHSNKIELELKKSLDGDRYIAMIDSLEKMPASEVMNLFQFIDEDETLRRRGMLIFVLYTGSMRASDFSGMKESEVAENILIEKWSPFIPKDSLSSVISRISGSIIKIH